MRHRTLRAAGLALAVAGLALPAVATATAAAATGDCRQYRVTDPAKFTTSGGGTVELTHTGAIFRTPDTPSKVTHRVQLHAPVPFSDVRALRYTTERQPGATGVDSTVAAYKLGVDANSDGTVDGVLVYEPYYNGPVAGEQRHDALGADRAGRWWYSAEPGNKQTTATFADWQAGTGPVAFPAPEVRWFAVEQGTWNAGAITRVDDVKFAATGTCKRITFRKIVPITKPVTTPPTTATTTRPPTTTPPTTRPPTTPPSTPPSSTPATDSPPDTEPTETAPPPAFDSSSGDALPVTGAPVGLAAVGGVALLAAGLVLLYVSRRRRQRFAA